MVFGWGSSSSGSNYPQPPSYSKDQHVASFLSHNTFSRGTIKVPTDPPTLLFETAFSPAANATPYTLQIYLPPTFPSTPPIITLTRPALATHPILNENMQCVHLDTIARWGTGSNGVALVAVVEEIAGKLIGRQPSIVGTLPPPRPQQMQQQQMMQQQTQQEMEEPSPRNSDSVFHMPIPPVPSKFDDLSAMSSASLHRLLDDDVAFTTYVEGLACVKTLGDLMRDIKEGNASAAKVNLSQEEDIATLHAESRVLQTELREKLTDFEMTCKRANAGDGLSERDILDLLRVSAREAEDATDALASSFVDGDLDIKEFVKEFAEKRKLFHERQAKIERLERNQQGGRF